MGGVKVSEIAYLAGTTVRTVRWYHRIGLLSIPEGRPGTTASTTSPASCTSDGWRSRG